MKIDLKFTQKDGDLFVTSNNIHTIKGTEPFQGGGYDELAEYIIYHDLDDSLLDLLDEGIKENLHLFNEHSLSWYEIEMKLYDHLSNL